MHEFDTDVSGAMSWVADLHKEVEKKFLKAMAALPKWGEPIDSQVRKYCDGLGSWVRGNDEWSFESERYLGSKGLEIQRKRWNTLIPKDCLMGPTETGPVLVDSFLKPVNAFNTEWVRSALSIVKTPLKLHRFWKEYGRTFDTLSTHHDDIRAVILSSAFPKIFSAGLDFQGLNQLGEKDLHIDPARRALLTRALILDVQHAVTAPERCPFPVIAAVHGGVVGLGIDIISALVNLPAALLCLMEPYYQEVDMGLAADGGTLAHLLKITGNHSLARELAYTSRMFSSDDALTLGLVSRVVEGGREAVVGAALQLAREIALKSPIAVSGTKHLLLHARDHSVAENLEYTATWNSAAVQAKDLQEAVNAGMTKSKEALKFLPLRPKL
ncbi:hypothetical protein AZE42_04482 [Rhizopogon vesiculosus]|uniref:Enoyl-CoA hydratase n=1 Tax=Rhizopogon vesiculosus TaxID=180088 RepID=A0A1J8QT66_9AGAM|nr:hypothetical protein AZE42_04482 [Rhizopogon vesiculosus]